MPTLSFVSTETKSEGKPFNEPSCASPCLIVCVCKEHMTHRQRLVYMLNYMKRYKASAKQDSSMVCPAI